MLSSLQNETGLSSAFIVRIGHQNQKDSLRNSPIIEAQNIFAGAKSYMRNDQSTRNLMRDSSHYVPEGYYIAGTEAGVNAGLYINSNKETKPILVEFETLYLKDKVTLPYGNNKFIYNSNI